MKNIYLSKGQNLIETFSYNNWNMLYNHTISNANADVYDMSYNYSRGWHLIEKADGIKNTSDKYAYDSYYRLKEVKYDFVNNTAARTDSFFADGVHNIEQSTENGTTFAWGVDKLNRLREKKVGNNTESAYEYDERNNMIKEYLNGHTTPDIKYFYDDLNRLIEVKDGSDNTIATYTYDAFNRRITKTVGSTTERYTYDDWNIVEISTNSNLYTNIIDSGMDRHIAIEVAANNTSTLYYFLTDERGNVTALTDANGNILERYRYRVYGDFEILDSQFTPKNCNNQTCYATNLHNFLWGGSLYEPETNLYWMRNRYYHIDMHRFINQDPIGIWGDANNLGNGFAYVAGMVIEASDPTGLEIIFWQDSKYPCDENMVNTIIEIVNTNSVVAELWDTAYNKDDDVYIECNKESGSNTAKDQDTGKYIINIGNETYTPAEKTAHELTHFIKHQSLVDKLADKPMDDLKQEIENYKKSGSIIDRIKAWFLELQQNYRQKEIDKAESEAVEKQQEAKEEEEKNKKGGEQYPADPDSAADKIQSYFANQFIKKILEMHEKKSFFEMMEEVGPIIRYEDNGRKIFFFNPYYRGKDPLKEIIWNTRNADGTRGFVRNPFVPGAEYGYDSSTYEKFQQAGFPQTNVDPYWQ